jgi:uncharacterized protein DUF4242
VELVLVERRFDEPVKLEDISKLMRDNSWCIETYKIRFVKTLFSRDRRRMLCLFEAPDTESVRLAEEKSRVPYDRAWACSQIKGESTVFDASASEFVVVERAFPTPVTPEVVSSALQRAGWCLDLHRVSYVESYLGGDGIKMVCVYRAPDAEAVRMANEKGQVPYTDVWTATVHGPGA